MPVEPGAGVGVPLPSTASRMCLSPLDASGHVCWTIGLKDVAAGDETTSRAPVK
jgi:hypothetical protein